MDMRIDDAVRLAGDHRRRLGDLAVSQRGHLHLPLQEGDVLCIRPEGLRAEQQRQAQPLGVVFRRLGRAEDALDGLRGDQRRAERGQRVGKHRAGHRQGGRVVIPVGTAGPGVGRRRQKHQPGKEIGARQRQLRRHRPAPGMADGNRPLDAEAVGQPGDQRRLGGRAVHVLAAALRIAVAGPVDEDEPCGLALRCRPVAQRAGQRHMRIAQVGTRPVHEDQRRIALAPAFGTDVEIVQPHAVDLGESADRRIALLRLAPAHVRQQGKTGEQQRQRRQQDKGKGGHGGTVRLWRSTGERAKGGTCETRVRSASRPPPFPCPLPPYARSR